MSASTSYRELQQEVRHGVWTDGVRAALVEVIKESVSFLAAAMVVPEISLVPQKSYVAFRVGDVTSRVVNSRLYDAELCLDRIDDVLREGPDANSPHEASRVLYTAAVSFCCANDIKSSNRARGKSGKFFEFLVGNMVATALGVRGFAELEALNPDLARGLNPDHLFDLGDGHALIHLAVKTSTRERIVQPWAHQRILDGAYGTDRIKGVMVFLTETNRLAAGIQETCTPERLRQYQMFVARIHAIYYFDPPEPYLSLARAYPFVPVRSIMSLWDDAPVLKNPSPWK